MKSRSAVPEPSSRSKTVRKWLKRTLWYVGSALCLFVIVGGVVFMPRLADAGKKIHNLSTIIEQVNSSPTVFVSADGETLYSVQNQYRRPVTIEEVPQVVIDATLAAEDKRFYHHDGIDFKAMTNLAFITLLSGGDIPRGGSTLSMQIAKRVYTSPEKTLGRKLDDMALAVMIERSLSKDQILALYLNQVFYGESAYGIGAAADVYFGKKDLHDLTLAECAMLARIVRRPSRENPFDDLETAIKNRNVVLSLMLDEDMISEEEYRAALKEKPELAEQRPPTVTGKKLAPYYVDLLMRELKEDFPDVDVTMGGYVIEGTMNWELQEYAEKQVEARVKALKGQKVTTGAFFLMDSDGAVLVHVGGADYDRNQFDVITQGARQPGSSFKPIMYATALERGVVTPHTLISNEVFYWDSGNGNPVMVRNSEGNVGGMYTVEQGIMKSLNIIAARVMVMTGPQNVVNQAHSSFGFKSRLQAYPSLALGSTAVSPLEMARAYSVFKTGGTRVEPYFIRRVTGPNGDEVRRYGPRYVRNALGADSARKMDTILYKAAHWGTGGPVTRTGAVNVHGKTGTTNDYRDAWFCGYTNRFIGVAWMGGEVKQGNNWIYPPMNRVFGGPSAGVIWGNVVKKAQQTLGEELATFTPYYNSDTIEVDGDPENNQFDELPPLDPNRIPPIGDGSTRTDSRPPTERYTPPPGDSRSVDIVYVEVCADSGGLANVYCPERVKKPFLKGAEPKGDCPVHRPPGAR